MDRPEIVADAAALVKRRTRAARMRRAQPAPAVPSPIGEPAAPAHASPTTPDADPAALLAWYDRHRRVLPWRALPGETTDPYRVWLSEIMLQQTTVRAVIPYFEAFTARWPTVGALAAEDREEVLRAWAGLGYYSRARNLHACAVEVATRHGGRFPDAEAGLRALPGVGAYTAAAIAAIAFGRHAAVVDGNIERVITRLGAIETPLPAAKPLVRARVDALTPHDRPGDFAQAMMDLGATICTPRRPACALCPWMAPCRARTLGLQDTFPRKGAKAARPSRRGLAFWATRPDGTVLVRTRPDKGLLGGMTEIPSSDWVADLDRDAGLAQAPLPATWTAVPGEARHGFTHFDLTLELLRAELPPGTPAPPGSRWVRLDTLGQEALPTAMRRVVALATGG